MDRRRAASLAPDDGGFTRSWETITVLLKDVNGSWAVAERITDRWRDKQGYGDAQFDDDETGYCRAGSHRERKLALGCEKCRPTLTHESGDFYSLTGVRPPVIGTWQGASANYSSLPTSTVSFILEERRKISLLCLDTVWPLNDEASTLESKLRIFNLH